MKELTDVELREQYADLSTEELIQFYHSNTLTELALSVLREELCKRGVPPDSIKSKPSNFEFQERPKGIPTSLTILSILFLLGGISSVIDVTVSLINKHININLGVLGLFIGPGLLRLNPACRTCALVFIWFILIVAPIAVIVSIVPFFMPTFGEASITFLLLGIVIFLFGFWSYRVLTNPDVRDLFGSNRHVHNKISNMT